MMFKFMFECANKSKQKTQVFFHNYNYICKTENLTVILTKPKFGDSALEKIVARLLS